MPLRSFLLLILLAPALGAAQELVLQMQPPASLDSGTFGANGEKGMGFQILRTGSGTLVGPFTLRVTLPEHTSFAGAAGGGWTCSAVGQLVTCTVNGTLDFFNPGTSGMGLYFDTDVTLPVPGSSVIRATVESAERPLPASPVCTAPSTPSQCLDATVVHRRSQVVFLASSWAHHLPVFEAGTLNTISVAWRNTGFSTNNGTVTARFQLPPGFTYSHHGGIAQWTCNAAAANAQGQLLTCTTPYFFDGMNESQANINLHVNVAPDVAIPGPHPIYATISNAQQPAPDFALCDDAQPPVGCGYYDQITTRSMRRSQLAITAMQHAPARFRQQSEGTLQIDLRNIGDGAAGPMTLEVAAPAGFAYDRAIANPSATCVATGSVASGQLIACQFPNGLPETFAGTISLVFDIVAGAVETSVAIAAIGDSTRPGPSLETCAANPALVGCGEHAIPVEPWIFCNGFEALPRVCGLPQPF